MIKEGKYTILETRGAVAKITINLKIDDVAVVEETQKSYPRYMPNIPYPSRTGIAVIKAFMEKSDPALRQLSIDDQIDMQFVRELEQSGFFSSPYRAR